MSTGVKDVIGLMCSAKAEVASLISAAWGWWLALPGTSYLGSSKGEKGPDYIDLQPSTIRSTFVWEVHLIQSSFKLPLHPSGLPIMTFLFKL